MAKARTGIRTVTDTTSCLPKEFAAHHHVAIVPQVIQFGQETFLEDVEITYEDFVQRLRSSSTLPSTAAPLVRDFVEAYGRQLEHAGTVLSIHPSTEVSGTVRSALTAKAEAFPEADIRVLDTRTVGGTLAGMVMAALEWAEAGVGPDAIMERLTAMISRSRTYFLVATLEYLQKGGRIGGASALLGTALQIKPLLTLRGGRVEVLEKVRTHHRALERLKGLVAEECPPQAGSRLCVMHGAEPQAAEDLANDLRDRLGLREVPIYPLGSAITTHGGSGHTCGWLLRLTATHRLRRTWQPSSRGSAAEGQSHRCSSPMRLVPCWKLPHQPSGIGYSCRRWMVE